MHKIIKSRNRDLEYGELKVGEHMILHDTGELIVGTRGGYFKFSKDGELIEELYNTVAPDRIDETVIAFNPPLEKEVDTTQVDLELTKAKPFLLRDAIKVVDYDDSVYIYFEDENKKDNNGFYNVKELSSEILKMEVVELYPAHCESLGFSLK